MHRSPITANSSLFLHFSPLHVVRREHVMESVLHARAEVLLSKLKELRAHGLVEGHHELLCSHPDRG